MVRPVGGGTVALLAVLTALVCAPYLAGVLLPCYANDLDALPPAELPGGGSGPATWPDGALGGPLQVAGALSLVVTPIGLAAALGWALYGLLPWRRGTPAVTAGLVLVVLACLGALAFLGSPLGSALATWQRD